MKILIRLMLPFCVCMSLVGQSQEKCPVNFEKITLADFDLTGKNVDTSFGAVILADHGKSSFEGNSKGYFSLVYRFNRRVKILNAKAFDIATVSIPLYRDVANESEEVLESLTATTYNIVNGKIEETKLHKDNVFKEVLDKKHVVKKFTMPAIKEGSIIDISYSINSDFLFNLQPWRFQGSYPRLWSEYNLNLPEFFKYVFITKGKMPFHIKDQKTKFQTYRIRIPGETAYESSEVISLNSNNEIIRWVMKDVPALKEESFTSSMSNHLAGMEFQMSGQQFPGMPYKDIMGSWGKVAVELLKDKEFGAAFNENADWVKTALKTIGTDGKDPEEKAKAIFAFVQNQISSNGTSGIYMTQSLKETFNSKKGYVPDVNLLLTLLLKKSGLMAYPVLLSTRSNGFANAEYPLMHQYNYVVCRVDLPTKSFYLDGSNRMLKFGMLPSYCYNGYGTLIDLNTGTDPLFADSLLERKITNIILTNGVADKNKWMGNFMSLPGYYESLGIKESIYEAGKSTFAKKIADAYTGDFAADNVVVEDTEDNNKNVTVKYNLQVNKPEYDILYFNPMMKEGLKENYFKAGNRRYPVEMPYRFEEIYNLHLEIPEGYVVDELPKSTRVSLFGSDGMFEYIIAKNETAITFRSIIRVNKAVFLSEDYEDLKSFFDFIVKKHAEQIVFKKKS